MTISTLSLARLTHVSLSWETRNSLRMFWASCMREHTGMMKKLADEFLHSKAKASPVASRTSIPTKSFSCGTCGKKFLTLQAATTTGADRLEPTTSTKADDVQCANAHSTKGYAQSSMWHQSRRAAKALLASGDYEKIPEAHRTMLHNADCVEARAARKSGVSVSGSHGLRAVEVVWSYHRSSL